MFFPSSATQAISTRWEKTETEVMASEAGKTANIWALRRTRAAVSILITAITIWLWVTLLHPAYSQRLPFAIRKIIAYGFPLLLIAAIVAIWLPRRLAVPLLLVAGCIWLGVPLFFEVATPWPPTVGFLIAVPLGLLAGLLVAWAAPKWSWLQFRLRTLLVLVLICCGSLMAFDHYLGKPGREQAQAIARIQTLGGDVQTKVRALPWLVRVLGEQHFREVNSVSARSAETADEILALLPRLGGFKGVATIRSVSLGYSSVSDEGLAKIAICTHLTSVNLEHTRVSDAGIQHLAACKLLEEIDLNQCSNVTDRSVPVFIQLPNLRLLLLMRTRVTEIGWREMREAMPLCSVSAGEEFLFRNPTGNP